MKGIHNRLGYIEVIAHLLSDVKTSIAGINTHELDLDLGKVKNRARHEGIGFFTKSLPALGKALDRALLAQRPLDVGRLQKLPSTQLPKFLGELFKRVFSPAGELLAEPSIQCIHVLRDLLFVFYKYEVSYSQTQSDGVIASFIENEKDIASFNQTLCTACDSDRTSHGVDGLSTEPFQRHVGDWHTHANELSDVVASMRKEAHRLFSSLDLTSIVPKHGPGVVSTGEKGPLKYRFSRYSEALDAVYPYTEYMVPNIASEQVSLPAMEQLVSSSPSAKVILVPKDSRGPRLISCEPLEHQWIQQGIKDKIVLHIENHPVMGGHVNFTDQTINRNLALQGSLDGALCTLDLKDASDRISLELVRRIFPDSILDKIFACRTRATQLPDGTTIHMAKFAPMGSALCFPIMASVIWIGLTAGKNACSRKTTYVYGDDIIVQRTDVPNAIKRLELIGLKVNENKSCTSGLFRESCGMDAYSGVCITPFRLRKVWCRHPSPEIIVSFIAKANEAYNRGYHSLANYIARLLSTEMRNLPYSLDSEWSQGRLSSCPHLRFLPTPIAPKDEVFPYGYTTFDGTDWRCSRLRQRVNPKYQILEYQLLTLLPKVYNCADDELNYFKALHNSALEEPAAFLALVDSRRLNRKIAIKQVVDDEKPVKRASVYTHNRASKLVRKWR